MNMIATDDINGVAVAALQMGLEELKFQCALNDVAVKSAGLQVAEGALALNKKYETAIRKLLASGA